MPNKNSQDVYDREEKDCNFWGLIILVLLFGTLGFLKAVGVI